MDKNLFNNFLNICLQDKTEVQILLIGNSSVVGNIIDHDNSCIILENFRGTFCIPINAIAGIRITK